MLTAGERRQWAREIREDLLDYMEPARSRSQAGALRSLREAAEKMTILVRLEMGGGTEDAKQADQGHQATADAPRG